jgi:hypothetical protein
MNDGDVGAELFLSLLASTGRAPVVFERRLLNEDEVLMPKFFKFLGFLAGVVGLCSSKNVFADESDKLFSVLRERKSDTKDVAAALATGDSGDGPGEGSVTEEESMVDMVVVGELSEDSEATVEVLSRCTWKAAKVAFNGADPLGKFPLEAGRIVWLPCAPVLLRSDRPLRPLLLISSPNTDMNEGIGRAVVRGLVCTILSL